MASQPLDIELSVRERYSEGAQRRVADLCCPVDYDPRYLAMIPQEVLDRDYGCGDPSKHLLEGETVLDLGSGGGKVCFIASQVVGPAGRVIGVDANVEMQDLARRHRGVVAAQVGWDNVEFRRGRIQDLRLDLEAVHAWLQDNPVTGADQLSRFEAEQLRLRREQPLIPDDSVDVVVSNCVLNLVKDEDKVVLFEEIARVLKRGGRAVISDIVADEEVPEHLKADPVLWSGCVSGALTETGFLEAFERAGFYGIEILNRSEAPWRTVEGIEFRSVTVRAYHGKSGPCFDTNKAVVYRGPWRRVTDDDGHVFHRGVRTAVCEKTFQIMQRQPFADEFEPVLPRTRVDEAEEKPFLCSGTTVRDPKETKGLDFDVTTEAGPVCEGPDCC